MPKALWAEAVDCAQAFVDSSEYQAKRHQAFVDSQEYRTIWVNSANLHMNYINLLKTTKNITNKSINMLHETLGPGTNRVKRKIYKKPKKTSPKH